MSIIVYIINRKYDREFKKEAVRLVLEGKRSAAAVERDLGTGSNMISRWVKEYKRDPKNSYPGKGHLKAEDAELKSLRKENEILRRERAILKKAVAIFSTDPKRYLDS